MLKTLDSVDAYLHLQEQAARLLRKGFMHLAEAKYVLGPAAVSHHAYDNRMQASAFCSTTSTQMPDNASEHHDALAQAVAEMNVNLKPALTGDVTEEGGLRHRKKAASLNAGKEEDEVVNTESKEARVDDCDGMKEGNKKDAKATTPRKDPIYMFSALPPKSLRDAQTAFSELVALVPKLQASRKALDV
ncbi:hypothetical protein BC830DRAFT_82152 [Chytriomyces sp. MP71]|nr:hypothetical protein BC830DRAFT_82152 [Chytriomyces sp. MP71]